MPDCIVRLISFNSENEAPHDVEPRENYWLLIGQTGTVVKDQPPRGVEAGRVLVQFGCNVKALGLECHNEVENALWISKGDLAL